MEEYLYLLFIKKFFNSPTWGQALKIERWYSIPKSNDESRDYNIGKTQFIIPARNVEVLLLTLKSMQMKIEERMKEAGVVNLSDPNFHLDPDLFPISYLNRTRSQYLGIVQDEKYGLQLLFSAKPSTASGRVENYTFGMSLIQLTPLVYGLKYLTKKMTLDELKDELNDDSIEIKKDLYLASQFVYSENDPPPRSLHSPPPTKIPRRSQSAKAVLTSSDKVQVIRRRAPQKRVATLAADTIPAVQDEIVLDGGFPARIPTNIIIINFVIDCPYNICFVCF